jgi:hypothetical protein
MGQLQDAAQGTADPVMLQQMKKAASSKPVDPAVGQIDSTSPEARADPNIVTGNAASATEGVIQAREAKNAGPSLAGEDEEATPEEQAEYDRALDGLHQILYEDPERSQAIADTLQPQDKIGSVTRTAIMLIKQLDEGIDLDENVVAEITVDTADRLMEIGEASKGMTFSEKEAQAVAGATWEGVMALFGVDQDSVTEMTAGMTPEQLKGYEQQHKQFVGD